MGYTEELGKLGKYLEISYLLRRFVSLKLLINKKKYMASICHKLSGLVCFISFFSGARLYIFKFVCFSTFWGFFAMLHGTWDLSSLTRDHTPNTCIGSTQSTTGLSGKSLQYISLIFHKFS